MSSLWSGQNWNAKSYSWESDQTSLQPRSPFGLPVAVHLQKPRSHQSSDQSVDTHSWYHQPPPAGHLTDVTLASENGRRLEAHKVILAATSSFSRMLLKVSNCFLFTLYLVAWTWFLGASWHHSGGAVLVSDHAWISGGANIAENQND